MNPFTQFSRAERTRKYQDLSVAEKITLNTTRFFLSSKTARSFVFFYALGLHLLVFFTLYLWTVHHCRDGGMPAVPVPGSDLPHIFHDPAEVQSAVSSVVTASISK
jgi:hypothetical protein